MNITSENYMEELLKTINAVEALRNFTKRHPFLYFGIARANGKSRFAYRFIKHYSSFIRAYEKAEKEALREKRPGFFCRIFKKDARNGPPA